MPIFNAGGYLRQAVLSIIGQTYEDWELLIIDDGSTDNALESLSDIADRRISILCDGANRGLAARLNEAMDAGRGVLFARMDQDDISFPERLARQVQFLRESPAVDLVSVKAVTISEDGEENGHIPFRESHEELCAAPWRGFYMVHPTWMGRMEWFRKHRYTVPGPYFCEDQELLLRAYPCSRFAAIPEVLFAYRRPERPRLKKHFKTRLTVLQMQLRHFLGRRQWGFALLAVGTFLGRLLLDGCRLPARLLAPHPR